MGTLTWLTEAVIRDNQEERDAKVLTRPALLVTDGQSILYAVDLDVGITDTTGYDEAQDLVNANIVGSILHNVPIAPGNDALIYADVGAAVRIRRTTSGRYEVIGFALSMPGTNIRVPVNLEDLTFGEIDDRTLTSRALTLAELSTFGTFGDIPLGAIALFRGTTLLRISA